MSEYKPGYARALELVLAHVPTPGPSGEVALSRAVGRVAAREVVAAAPFPGQGLSMLDGLAVAEGSGAGRQQPVRTGEPVPEWATEVIPSELLGPDGTVTGERGPDLRPSIVAPGAEYRAGDPILTAGAKIDHRHVAQLSLFGIGTVQVFRRPRVRIAVFDRAPYAAAVLAWLDGFLRSHYDVDVAPVTVSALEQVLELGQDTDLGLVVSDGAPGRYDEIRRLARSEVVGFETRFWKLGLSPPKHVGFGTIGAVPVLVFPDVFFKTVLSAMAFLPAVLAAWVGARPRTRPARWTALPEISYPFPCLVPLRFEDERQGLRVAATPLGSSFSARWASAAEGFAILEREPYEDDEIDATVLGLLEHVP